MGFQMLRTGTTFEVIDLATGKPVFSGSMADAMREHSRLSLAAKGPAKASSKMAKRAEKQQAGVR